jgi:hypothetical protein
MPNPNLALLGVKAGIKVLELLRKLGAVIKEKPPQKSFGAKNQVTNFGGVVNQNITQIIFAPNNNQPIDDGLKDKFISLIQKQPYSIDSVDLTEKKSLIANNQETDKDLLSFVLTSIPTRDQSLWKAGLLLRKCSQREEYAAVANIKKDMITADGLRGKNIANLCSADYLETEIIPAYKALTDVEKSEDFLQFYDALVTQTPTSIFVGAQHTEVSLKKELLDKIEYARKYSAPYIKVHAIGRSHVMLAREVIKEIRVEMEFENVFYSEEKSHLNATLIL